MARTSSRPESVVSSESEPGCAIRYGSGRWRNNNKVSGTRFKICLCGKFDVGKTSIFLRLQGQDFSEAKPICQTTTYEFYDEDDKSVEFSIWDTNGFEELNALSLGDHYRNAHCILLVYDVSNFESLEYLDYELAAIDKHQYAPDAKFILIQNKADIKPSKCISEAKQKEFICKSRLGSKVDFFCRTSAKLNEGIEELFKTNLKEILVMPVSEETEEKSKSAFDKFIDEGDGSRKKRKRKCRTM